MIRQLIKGHCKVFERISPADAQDQISRVQDKAPQLKTEEKKSKPFKKFKKPEGHDTSPKKWALEKIKLGLFVCIIWGASLATMDIGALFKTAKFYEKRTKADDKIYYLAAFDTFSTAASALDQFVGKGISWDKFWVTKYSEKTSQGKASGGRA